jgi:hypothetical protein
LTLQATKRGFVQTSYDVTRVARVWAAALHGLVEWNVLYVQMTGTVSRWRVLDRQNFHTEVQTPGPVCQHMHVANHYQPRIQ